MDKIQQLNDALVSVGPIADQINVPIGFIVISGGEKFAVKFSLSPGLKIVDSVESAINFIIENSEEGRKEFERRM